MNHEDGRLSARPLPGAARPPQPAGIRKVDVGGDRAALISVPPGYRPDAPAPLLVILHGAGGDAQGALGWMQAAADAAGVILVAPQSEQRTWDFIVSDYGPDVARIDRALEEVFAGFAVDPARVAVGGFSDGASYALSLGLVNGDLFPRVVAYSPGFMAPTGLAGQPRFFVSHGTADRILAIDRCSRTLVPKLQAAGFDVLYREFTGGHLMPPDIVAESMRWFLGTP